MLLLSSPVILGAACFAPSEVLIGAQCGNGSLEKSPCNPHNGPLNRSLIPYVAPGVVEEKNLSPAERRVHGPQGS